MSLRSQLRSVLQVLWIAGATVALLAALDDSAAWAQSAVYQRGYDAGVTGSNLNETTLTPANVTASTFGMLFKLPVDDNVSAQPLYVPGVAVSGQGTHNVVYVATMSNSIYAFDADTGGSALWHVNLGTPVPMNQFSFQGNMNIVGNLGILSTPVIDSSTGTLYVVTCTLEGGAMTYRLHALSIASGAESPTGGVVISGNYKSATFDSRYLLQRTALVIAKSQVILCFSAVELEEPGDYEGWVIGYNKSSLDQSSIFATITSGNLGGGVWMSGRPPAVDPSGDIYVFTGNGYTNGYDGVNNFGESALKLDPAQQMKRIDSFTPSNWSDMDSMDRDLSSSGPLLIPGTSPLLLVGGGKTVTFYVLDTSNLGGFNSGGDQVVQEETVTTKATRTGPVYWQRSSGAGGPLLFNWGVSDWVKSFSFSGNQLSANPVTQGSGSSYNPGGNMTLTAHGDHQGILWATVVTGGDDQESPPAPGQLRALDPTNLAAADFWNSGMNSSRDGYGNFSKFAPPVVINGKVYVATWSNQVVVYGLLIGYKLSPTVLPFNNQAINVASSPMSVTLSNTGGAALAITSISIGGTNPAQFSQTNTCGSSVPGGGNCTISVVFKPTNAGAKSATLSVNAGGGAGTQKVALTGTGVSPPFSVSPTALPFGNQTIKVASSPMTVTVSNSSTTALPITSIAIGGSGSAAFSQTNTCGSSIPASSGCTISVVFKPTNAGAKSATLSVNAGGGAGTQKVALTGTGVSPPFSVSPASLPFGNVTIKTSSSPMTATVSNTSTAAISISSIAIGGTNAAAFSESNNCGSSVGAGGSCIISVVFKPPNAGAKTASLTVNAGSAGSQSVALSGTGS